MSGALVRLAHVILAVAFITGLIGRAVAFRHARFRMLELAIVATVFVLMVLKPF